MPIIKPIPGFSAYGASRDGRIWRLSPGPTLMAQRPNHLGYYRVGIVSDKGERKTIGVARLVLMAWEGMPDGRKDAAHWNGIRHDNRLANLRWASRKENYADRVRHGRSPDGERNGKSKLTLQQAKRIKALALAGKYKQREIAAMFGISAIQVSCIKTGRKWNAAISP